MHDPLHQTFDRWRLGLRFVGILLSVVAGVFPAVTAANEPPLPPGAASPPGAVMVALLGPGVDYRLTELQGRLARDGEGDLIAWDFSDGDNRPFPASGDPQCPVCQSGTAVATTIAAIAPDAALVIVKQRPDDPQAFGHMMSFAAKTPARIIVWLDADPQRPDWPILAQAVRRFPDRLFIVPFRAAAEPQSQSQSQPHNADPTAAFAGIRATANTVVTAFRSPAAQSAAGPATADVWSEVAVGSNDTDDILAYRAAACVAGLAAREQSMTPALSISELKMRVVGGRLTSLTIGPGQVSGQVSGQVPGHVTCRDRMGTPAARP